MDDDAVKRLAKILGVAILMIFVFKFIGVRMATSVGERKLQRQQQVTPAPAAPIQNSAAATSPAAAPETGMTQESIPAEGYPESPAAPQSAPGSEIPASESPTSPAPMPESPAPADATGNGAPPPQGDR